MSCSTHKQKLTLAEEKPVRITNNELEYELIILDVGFNNFLNTIAKPRGFYGLTRLENRNRYFVSIYNNRVSNSLQFGNTYGPHIYYQNHISYGYEVNYLLYNYFLFFQKKYKQKL